MKEELTQDYLKYRVMYYPETGNVYWRSHPRSTSIGKEVGNVSGEGYRVCKVDSTEYKIHRLIFLYMTGSFPPDGLQVDHINGLRDDNRWLNLRLCTQTQNSQNTRLLKNTPTGVKGLIKEKGRVGQKTTYLARISANGENFSKRLVFTPETEAAVKQELIDWLISQRNNLHGEFANYG